MGTQEIAKIKVGSQSYTIMDRNITSDEIAFSSFSGMMGFVGELGKQTIKKYGLNAIYGSRFGRVFDVVDGVINGVFDANMNPDKGLEKLIGTQFLAWGSGEIGASIGGAIGGPPGAVAGAVIGSIVGGINADDWYEDGEIFLSKLKDVIEDSFEYFDSTIYGKVTQKEYILQELSEHPTDFCMQAFPKYTRYRQITEIRSGRGSLMETLRYDSNAKHATIKTAHNNDKQDIAQVKKLTSVIYQDTAATTLKLNGNDYDITTADNIVQRNAMAYIPSVSYLLSQIKLEVGDRIDLGSYGIYKVKDKENLSTIAESHGYLTSQVVQRNPWLFDKKRITFNQSKVLLHDGAPISSDTTHEYYNEYAAKDYFYDANGGFDYYHVGNLDIVRDEGGLGRVFFDDTLLSGTKTKIADNVWEDAEHTYTLNDSNLTVTQKNSLHHHIKIEEYSNGRLEPYEVFTHYFDTSYACKCGHFTRSSG